MQLFWKTNRARLQAVVLDIRFWIVLFFLLRLVGITDPPLEAGHNWRQSLTAMIARNFADNGANLLYPTIDMAGNASGIIGSEFPFFNYLIHLVASLFDYAHWYGRPINLLVSSIGLYYFHKLVRQLFTPAIAFHATIVLAVSIWFAFSRKIMPDTFSVSLVLIGLYHAYLYIVRGSWSALLLFLLLATLGMLCKIPASSLLVALAVLLVTKGIDARRKWILLSATVLSAMLVAAWYFLWVPHLLATYHYQLYFPKGLSEGLRELAPLMPEVFEKFYFIALHSYLAFLCCAIGAVLVLRSERRHIVLGLALITAVFALFIVKTGAVFPLHSYYIVPFVPVMAVLAGTAIARAPRNYQYPLLFLIAVEAIANQQHDFRITDDQLYKLSLEGIADRYIPKDDRVIINGGSSPQDIYFLHRKGWTVSDSSLAVPQYVDSLVALGARYLVLDRCCHQGAVVHGEQVYADAHYAIHRLR